MFRLLDRWVEKNRSWAVDSTHPLLYPLLFVGFPFGTVLFCLRSLAGRWANGGPNSFFECVGYLCACSLLCGIVVGAILFVECIVLIVLWAAGSSLLSFPG